MKENLSHLPTNKTERQEILKQAFLISKSGSIKDIYATAQKICSHKGLQFRKIHSTKGKSNF